MNYAKFTRLIRSALKEDIGKGDITTELTIPKNKTVKAFLLAKENCIACGLKIVELVFKIQDKEIKFQSMVKEGHLVKKGKKLAMLQGKARSILTAERVALNFLSLLCGIATKTKAYVEKIKPYKVKIMDTRKTIPGLRDLEKYAVRTGGGFNHRFRLDEMVLVKDNHLKVAKGYLRLPEVPKGYRVDLEVKNLKEFKEAIKLKPDIIMLDNMSLKDIRKAVALRAYRLMPKLEASGGITLKNIRKIAACGVEMISVGELTHSINSTDISLEVLSR